MGGSLIFDADLRIKNDVLTKLGDIFKQAKDVVGIVIGGGKIAREYIQAARNFDTDEAMCDSFGIQVSRLNAKLLQVSLGDRAYPKIIENLEDARLANLWDRVILAGGFIPGQSTTSVTFELAEALGVTDIYILTDVDGIYDKDPHKFPDAQKFESLSITDLEQIIYGEGGNTQSAAGEYRIFDAVSVQIFKRNTFNVRLMNGIDFAQLTDLLVHRAYEKSVGTVILPK